MGIKTEYSRPTKTHSYLIRNKMSILERIQDSLFKIKENVNNNDLDPIGPGRELFALFCELGCSHGSGKLVIDSENKLIRSTAQLVADIQDWLLIFLNQYPDTVEFDEYDYLSIWDLETRSGIQFLFDLFKDIKVIHPGSKCKIAFHVAPGTETKLSSIFDDLTESVDDIDSSIKASKIAAHDIKQVEIPEHMPLSHHWWWFGL